NCMNKKIEPMNEILRDLVKTTHIFQAVIVDQNGLPIASWNEKSGKIENELENKISAIGASVFLLSEKTSEIFDLGLMEQMIIKNKKGKIVIKNINSQALIICVMEKKGSEALTMLKLKNTCEKLKKFEILNRKIDNTPKSDIFIPNID
ncbi:MAG: roadblock/LC7 domain-containing protein, partial [Candidatus Helarchaeota archaeon]